MRGLLLVGLFGCAGVAAAPPPAPSAQPALQPLGATLAIPGESMVYEIRFRGLTVGRVQVAVGQPGWDEGRPAIIVKSHGASEGLLAMLGELDWELATTIDTERGTPIRSTEHAIVTFRGKTETSDHDRDGETHTVHSAACILRGWHSVPGQHAQFALRIDDAHLGVDIHEVAHEFLDAQGKPAVRYEGIARSKFPFKLWFSDDAARVPLVLEASTKFGDIAVALVEYTAPRD